VARKRIVNGYCRECRKLAGYAAMRRAREKAKVVAVDLNQAVRRDVRILTVVSDPLKGGGFRAGVRFMKEEWEQMLKHLSFTPGTTLKDGEGRLYVFSGKEVWKER
jgi:hypothetical protein